jgi:bifunctional UDP-N-acetylglucosamine pyrophosphorylase/glucosamine-1-phosphate N-acetyltransferase
MGRDHVTANISVVILAAGQGTRMRSNRPKVLHALAGRPLLAHVIECAQDLDAAQICVVHGSGSEAIRDAFAQVPIDWAEQNPQLGTGHAVQQALPVVDQGNTVLVMYGDVPLIRPETLRRLLTAAESDTLAILTVEAEAPEGYGRIVRNAEGRVEAIVEERDANAGQRAIREINTGLLACPAKQLFPWLDRLKRDNAQGEYYLTDIISLARADGRNVEAVVAESEAEVMGINDKAQLAEAERAYQNRMALQLMQQGVGIGDPARIDIRGSLVCGTDVFIDINAVFEGAVELGDGVSIGPNAVIRNSRIAAGTQVHENCVLDGATIGESCSIGPFARLRPETDLSQDARVGNFVEIKKSTIGAGSKVNHLTYVGDADIGANVNIGAGTITCNYDGANKHRTVIGDGAFIGSGVELVAPVEVGAGATIGAGSSISRSVPAGELVVERSKQTVIKGWKRPIKKPDKEQ